jgi:hypothetical protein
MKKFLMLLAVFVTVTALFGKATGYMNCSNIVKKVDSAKNPVLSAYRSDVPQWLLRSIIVDR